MSPIIEQLSTLFRKFPGIGSRQAKRFVYFLLQQDDSYIRELMELITRARAHMRLCTESYQYFTSDGGAVMTSPIVRDDSRTKSLLMVVLKDLDLETIEKTHVYHGQYFVLGGFVPMIETHVASSHIRVPQLLSLVEKRAINNKLEEIILAFPLNTEGEHTRHYIQSQLEALATQHNIKISTLGRGLSTGTELEYIDRDTFTSALETRK